MKNKIYFVYGNHGSYDSIKHIYQLFVNDFKIYKFKLSKKIKKNSLNIIVENFDKKLRNEILLKNKGTKIISIYTEFFNFNAKTLNTFEYDKYIYRFIPTIFIRNLILFFNKFRKSILKILKKNKKKKKKNKFEKLTLAQKLIIDIQRLLKPGYFKERYNSAIELMEYFDAIICLHPKIYLDLKKNFDHDNIFLHLPKIKRLKLKSINKKNQIFKFSGDFNAYRKNKFDSMKKNFKEKHFFKLHFFDKLPSTTKFININKNKSYNYSLHPKKSKKWKFSSPTRLSYALNNSEIPIVFDNFNDITNKISLKIKALNHNTINTLIKDHKKNQIKLKKGIKIYNLKSEKFNNRIALFLDKWAKI